MANVIVALAAAVLLSLAQDRPAQPGQDKPGGDRTAGADLDRALAKAGEMNNYSASVTVKKEGADAKDAMPSVDIRVREGLVGLKSGDHEAYRKGDLSVCKEGAAWKKVEASTDKTADSDPVHKLVALRLPHEMLRDFKSTAFKQVRREDTEGSRIYSGELTDAALRQMLARHKKGDDATMTQATGSARIWFTGEGVINRFELVIDMKEASKEPGKTDSGEGRKTKTIEFRDIGSTKIDVPPDAQKLMDAK